MQFHLSFYPKNRRSCSDCYLSNALFRLMRESATSQNELNKAFHCIFTRLILFSQIPDKSASCAINSKTIAASNQYFPAVNVIMEAKKNNKQPATSTRLITEISANIFSFDN